jgi:hypothetical protein
MASIASPSAASVTDARDLANLQFRVEPFSEQHLPLVKRFSARYWNRPRTGEFYDWRYLRARGISRMFLAVTDDECLGMVFALRKTYAIGGVTTPCLDIFDWHSLPGLKGSGVGIRVMRALMREGTRLVGIGGTPEVLKALPAMGWQTIATATNYELPTSDAILAEGLRRRIATHIPGEGLALSAAAAWFKPSVKRYEGRAIPVASLGGEVDALYHASRYAFVQLPERESLAWITSQYPGTGAFQFWYAVTDGRLRGWLLSRLYETPEGREAAIVDIFAQEPDVPLYAWMISEAATALAGAHPRVIRARASCPLLQAALVNNRFRLATPVPVFTWPKLPVEGDVHVTLNHGDAPLRPYPTSTPGTEPAAGES